MVSKEVARAGDGRRRLWGGGGTKVVSECVSKQCAGVVGLDDFWLSVHKKRSAHIARTTKRQHKESVTGESQPTKTTSNNSNNYYYHHPKESSTEGDRWMGMELCNVCAVLSGIEKI